MFRVGNRDSIPGHTDHKGAAIVQTVTGGKIGFELATVTDCMPKKTRYIEMNVRYVI